MAVPFKIDLRGKTAVVTGGGGVLCSAFCEALAECGANVAVLDLTAERAEATADRIRAQGVFSASVVSEALLPAADFCGNHAGYAVDKSRRIPSGRGAVLPVPVPEESPWTLELQVEKTLRLDEAGRSEIYLCAIRNVLGDAALAEEGRPFAERVRAAGPVVSIGQTYFAAGERPLGAWGDWKDK